MIFDDIYKFVNPDNFGISGYKDHILISNGVRYALDHKALTPKQIDDAISKFDAGNFGEAYTLGENPIKGCEFGEYETDLTPGSERGYLWLHREQAYIIVYFLFER